MDVNERHYCEDCRYGTPMFYCETMLEKSSPNYVTRSESERRITLHTVSCTSRNYDGRCTLFETKQRG